MSHWHGNVEQLCCVRATDFFFSSRRRHTRWPRDWSSTCALPIFDLVVLQVPPERVEAREPVVGEGADRRGEEMFSEQGVGQREERCRAERGAGELAAGDVHRFLP